MNIQQICTKYKISDSYLNSKDDGLLVASHSVKSLIAMVEGNAPKQQLIEDLNKLSEFMIDVKNSSF
jgi:hypothetical protein